MVEEGKVACLVSPGDRAWACGDGVGCNSGGNDRSISIECNPRQSDGDYQTIAELVRDLLAVYGDLPLYPHKHFFNTASPGTYDLSRIDRITRELPDNGAHSPESESKRVATVPQSSGDTQPTHSLVPIHYRLHVLGGEWLPEVTNFGMGADGFAGLPCTGHDLLTVRVDQGQLRYRVHVLGGDWLDWVDHSDINDTVGGCAGIPGQAIDAVQCYYISPQGITAQAYYRSQTVARPGWLDICCDDGTTYDAYDDFAGIFGEPLDRLQIAISGQNPF